MPHSDIHGSKPARGSPWLFAACHVLHRLLVPRHPPNALIILRSLMNSRSPTMHGNHRQIFFLAFARKNTGGWFGIGSHPLRHDTRSVSLCSLRGTHRPDRSHNVSEPSPSDSGAYSPCFDTRRNLPGQTSIRTAGRSRSTRLPFHHTRPETHQNLIHPDKEQNHRWNGD